MTPGTKDEYEGRGAGAATGHYSKGRRDVAVEGEREAGADPRLRRLSVQLADTVAVEAERVARAAARQRAARRVHLPSHRAIPQDHSTGPSASHDRR